MMILKQIRWLLVVGVFLTIVWSAYVGLPLSVVDGVTIVGMLLMWGVGSLAVLCATPDNRDGWSLGLTMLCLCVGWVLSEFVGQLMWLADGLMIVATVLWVAVAYTSKVPDPRRAKRAVWMFGLIGGSVYALSFVDFLPITDSMLLLSYLFGVGLIHLFLVTVRFGVAKADDPERIPLRIISRFSLLSTAVAIVAGVFVQLLGGRGLYVTTWVLWSLYPIGYAYAIYRRNYLELDFFVTRRLTWFVATLIVTALCIGAVVGFSRMAPAYEAAGFALLFPLIGLLPVIRARIERSVDYVVFGNTAQYEQWLEDASHSVSGEPTLERVYALFKMNCERLGIADCAFYLMKNEMLRLMYESGEGKAEETVEHDGLEVEMFTDGTWHCIVPLCVGERKRGAFLLSAPRPDGYLNERQFRFLVRLADMLALACTNIILTRQYEVSLLEKMEAAEGVRTEIGTVLHSTTLNDFASLNRGVSDVQIALNQGSPVGEVSDGLDKIKAEIRMSADGLRSRCRTFLPRPLRLHKFMFIREQLDQFEMKSKIKPDCTITLADESAIRHDVADVLDQIVRDGLNNIIEHAEATAVTVDIDVNRERLLLRLADNGNGLPTFDIDWFELCGQGHLGLFGMVNVARRLGGRVTFSEADGGGTVITVRIDTPY